MRFSLQFRRDDAQPCCTKTRGSALQAVSFLTDHYAIIHVQCHREALAPLASIRQKIAVNRGYTNLVTEQALLVALQEIVELKEQVAAQNRVITSLCNQHP